MAENTRKTSNIIHTVDDLKTDVINNSEDIQSNTDAINNLVIPNAANDGKINLSQGNGIRVTGTDATADQAKDTSWTVAVDNTVALKSDLPVIPAPVVPGDGTMKLSGGTGIDVTGANGTANQTGDSNQTIAIDSTVALKSDIPTIPPAVVPGDGDIKLKSSDGSVSVQGKNASANQVGDTEWDLSVDVDNIDNIVKDIVSANPSTLTVSEADGIYTLTAVGGGGGGGGGIIVMEGDGIKVDSEIVEIDGDDYTKYTITVDKDWLEANLDFVTNQDLTDAIGNIEIPEIPEPPVVPNKTSDLTNDGEDGLNPFITAGDIPVVPKATLPIGDVAETVKVWAAAANYINFDTGSTNDFKMDPSSNFTAKGRIISKATGIANVAFGTENGDDGFAFIANGYPGIVSNGEQIQNYNYQEFANDETGDVYQRYQSTVKARKGPTSYSELMFLSDDPQNKGLRFLSCGLDVDTVVGWPATSGYTSDGASAILYTGYEFQNGVKTGGYSPFVLGSINNADVCFIQDSYPFMTLDASENDIVLHVPLDEATVKNNLIVKGQIQTDTITSEDAAVGDASINLGSNFTVKTNGTEALKIDANHAATFDGHIGVMGPSYTTASIALHSEVKPVNAGGAYAIWASPDYVVNPDATYAKHARAYGSVKAPANGQAFDTFTQFYASAVCGNAVGQNFGVYVSALGAINNIGIAITKGGAVADGNWGIYDNTGYDSYFGGDIQVGRIVGTVSDTDASIELKTNLIVSTSGVERLRITDTDIKAADGYEPQTDDSLVTKKWVLDNSSDGGGGESYDDTQIKADLASETDARVNADVALQGNISSEATTRSLADDALAAVDAGLQDQIDNLDLSGDGGDVTKITAGTNVTVNPSSGIGNVTVNADVGVTSIIGGDNVTISPEDGTGNVIINATSSGGADSLEELDDVVITDLMGNQVLTYDITTGKWINKSPSAGGGGVIDGGQVPGSGSTFLWYDTDWRVITVMDGVAIPQTIYPKDMFCYDGVFSDGVFWTIDGVDIRVDPSAEDYQGRFIGKFDANASGVRSLQGRVIAGQFGYQVGPYFSQDMKQWTQASNSSVAFIQQKQRPMGILLNGYLYEYRGGVWRLANLTHGAWGEIFPGGMQGDSANNYYYSWASSQASGQESAVAVEATWNQRDYVLYCVDIDSDRFVWGDSSADAENTNDALLKNGTTAISELDGCTTGFYSERLEKWFFAKEATAYISKTSSLKGGFNQRTLPRSNAWDRCYDDGHAIVFARTGTGNSATVFTLETTDSPGNWQVSISLINRNYDNICGTNGRGMATHQEEKAVSGFLPDPADPTGEGSIPVFYTLWRYGVSGVNDPNPHDVTTHSLVLSNPVDPNVGRTLEDGTEPASLLTTQEDANEYFSEQVASNTEIAENAATTAFAAISKATQNEGTIAGNTLAIESSHSEIAKKTAVVTLTQEEYDSLSDVDENTLYLIT